MMMISGLGGGAGGMQDKDPNLANKIAKLKQSRRSPEDTVRRFLEQNGVDPDTVAFSPVMAQDYLAERMDQYSYDTFRMEGNSMGLQRFTAHGYDSDDVVITGQDSPEFQWFDLNRAHTALVKANPNFYTFTITRSYDDVGVTPVDAPPIKHEDPTKYPSGTVLRVEKQSFEGNQLILDSMYIRIGGPVDDTTPVNLDSMQPIQDLRGWLVREELS